MRRIMALVVLMPIGIAACRPASIPTAHVLPEDTAVLSPVPASASPSTAIASETPTEGPETNAGAFPNTSAYSWNLLASGFESPVDIQFPPDGTGRMFIVEQAGRIRVVGSGMPAGAPFLDAAGRVNSSGNEQGKLGQTMNGTT
jgi:glucose/arabinose dehydrogenase